MIRGQYAGRNPTMKILFIGGTGIISTACSRLVVARGHELYLLNRGETTKRPAPVGAHLLRGDIRNRESARAALKDHRFDVVVDWIAFTPDHIESDLELFRGRAGQYVFISSASAYQKPIGNLPITESTPLANPLWLYSRNKIACEDRLLRAYRDEQFPMTIVRPSHTYDPTLSPIHGGYTMIDRMRQGRPVIVHGDGTSLWTLTHHTDFAKGFVGVLGNPHAMGDAYHITSDEVLTWNQIYTLMAHAAGVEPKLVYVPSDFIAAFDPEWGDSLLGDKAHSVLFDNTKIKRLVPDFMATTPFARGVHEIIAWFDADPARRVIDAAFNQTVDRILAAYQSAWPR
jgi:nucleoside-diphosphate-sugar epimerase